MLPGRLTTAPVTTLSAAGDDAFGEAVAVGHGAQVHPGALPRVGAPHQPDGPRAGRRFNTFETAFAIANQIADMSEIQLVNLLQQC